MNAAFGTVLALFAKSKGNIHTGQVVDTSIYESMWGLMEGFFFLKHTF